MSDPESPLSYETPRKTNPVVIERFADGGVTVTIHLDPLEMIWPAVQRWGVLAILFIVVWVRVLKSHTEILTALMVLGLPFIALCIGMIAIRAFRYGRPIVIGVSPREVYLDDPRRLLRVRQKFRPEELILCQPVQSEIRNRNGRLMRKFWFLELQFRSKLPMKLLKDADREQVIEVSEALRDALGMNQSLKNSSSA